MRFRPWVFLLLTAAATAQDEGPHRPILVRALETEGFVYAKFTNVPPLVVMERVAAVTGWTLTRDRGLEPDGKPIQGWIERADAQDLVRWLALVAGVEVDIDREARVFFLRRPYLPGKESGELAAKGRGLFREQALRWLKAAIQASPAESRQRAGLQWKMVELLLAGGGAEERFRRAGDELEKLERFYDRLRQAEGPGTAGRVSEELNRLRLLLARTKIRLGECLLGQEPPDPARAKRKFDSAMKLLQRRGGGLGRLYFQAKSGLCKATIRIGESIAPFLRRHRQEIGRVRESHPREWLKLQELVVEGYCLAGLARLEKGDREEALDRFEKGDEAFAEIRCEKDFATLVAKSTWYFAGRAAVEAAFLRREELARRAATLQKKMRVYLLGPPPGAPGAATGQGESRPLLARFLVRGKPRDPLAGEAAWLVNLDRTWSLPQAQRRLKRYLEEVGESDENDTVYGELEKFHSLFLEGDTSPDGLSEQALQRELARTLTRFTRGVEWLLPLARDEVGSAIPRERDVQARLILARVLLEPRVTKALDGLESPGPLVAMKILESLHTCDPVRLERERQRKHDWKYGLQELAEWARLVSRGFDLFGDLQAKRTLYEWIVGPGDEVEGQLEKMIAERKEYASYNPYTLLPEAGLELARLYLESAAAAKERLQGGEARKWRTRGRRLLATMAAEGEGEGMVPALVRWIEVLLEEGMPERVVEETAKAIRLLAPRHRDPTVRRQLSRLFTLRMKAFLRQDDLAAAALAAEGKGVLR